MHVYCIRCNQGYTIHGITKAEAAEFICIDCCGIEEYSLRRVAQLEESFQQLNNIETILEKADAFALTRDNPFNWINDRCVYTHEFDNLEILIRLNERSGVFHTRQIENGILAAMEIW